MNYDTLRQEGIKQIERLGSTFWTDYNAHDPGITILEQLCYALTDLLYRIDYDIADILAEGGSDPLASLSRPEKILPSNPVTLQDLRKLIIRMPGVRNAWIERAEQIPIIYFNKEEGKINIYQDDETAPFVLRGIYRIEIEEEGDGNININEIKNKLYYYRNIAEDFTSITILEKQKVCIDAVIEIENTEEHRKIQVDIYNKIEDYFSPPVRFYSLAERLNTIKYVDEIFEGPFFEDDLLKHGFIDSQELQRASRRTELRTSDIIHILMDIQGVRAVREISLRLTGNDNKADWLLQLDSSKVPRLDKEGSNIKLTKGDVEIHLSSSADTADTSYRRLPPQKLPLPAGRNRQIDNYYSIQHQFPDTYGVNKSGLSASASPLRKAQAKQLKAYLLLFDQLLANSFSQLANVRKLFSFAEEDAGSSTYFSQVVNDAELGIDEIYRGIWTDSEKRYEELKRLVKSSDDNERRNRFLNHLLARFAEQLVLPPSKEQKEQLQLKRKYLQNYEEISLLRSTAANYWQKSRCRTGLERRISLKLGIDDNAFCLIEHILLRPISEDLSQNQNIEILSLAKPDEIDNDPYSLRITLILSASSLPEGERDAVQQQMLEEIPAHLKASFLWLSQSDFPEFEKSYATWWNLLVEDTSIRRQKLRTARDRIIDLIGLGRTYPLSDLDVKTDMVAYGNKGKILLEFSQADVLYYLCDINGKRLQDAVAGNDGAIYLETPTVIENVTYKILACKKNKSDHSEEKYKTFLQKKAVVKVGLNVFLEVEISAEIDADGNTVPADAALSVTAARLILFSSRVKVKIKDAQEGVLYKLYARNGDQEILLSKAEGALGLGKGNFIELESVELNEDTVIFVKAEGVVQKNTGWLNSTLSVLVRANTDLNIAHSPSSVLAFNKDEASIKILKSQKGVRYQAYLHEISDDEFVYGEYLPNLLKTNEPDVHIKQPAWQAVWQETPAGSAEKPDKEVEGNDGEIELKLGRLRQDSLIIIKAVKEHQEGIHSKVQLKSALAFLIEPDHSKIPRIKINLKDGNLYSLQVEDGETGVFYHFRLEQEGKEICLPAYFHQLEEGNAENKGIERLRIERDFVIADSETKPKYLELQLDQPLQFSEESLLHIRARKARTNVWVDFEPPIPISTLPKIEH